MSQPNGTSPDRPGGNRLASETSPYLLQHADNPVHWQPWDETALAEARERGVPILLSIGYSACHWCHVMAHESFEDPATAELMNDLFVNIKVDREERPDLDRIYQLAQQAITRRGGGWPLTMFLDPRDQQAFFGGTYFPPTPRHGLPAFPQLLKQVATYYHDQSEQVAEHGRTLAGFFDSLNRSAERARALDAEVLEQADGQLLQHFERQHGGFSNAPKFPHASNIARCLRRAAQHGQRAGALRHAAEFSLLKMAEGGLYDHLGGGFCRYSVDAEWMIPHFEKMLYDNAALLPLYADWAVAGGPQLAAERVEQSINWLLREMRAPEGGFYSALDADSEGEEGRFYLWTPDAVRELLTAEEFAVFAPRFGLDRAANFEGRWHLHGYQPEAALTSAARDAQRITELLASARDKLLAERAGRVRPGCDDKILTAWNGMTVRALAVCGQRFGRDDWLDAAEAALDFIRNELWRDGRLLASYRDGQAKHAGYLDDYAFVLDGALALLEARWDSETLAFARALADALLAHFENPTSGGFYFTADDHEQLIHRPVNFADEALPSGNALACRSLLLLGWLLGETRYMDAAGRVLLQAMGDVSALPIGHCSLLEALEDALKPPVLVILRGDAAQIEAWRTQADRSYTPELRLFAIPAGESLPANLAVKGAAEKPLAYVCRGLVCDTPIASRKAFDDLIETQRVRLG